MKRWFWLTPLVSAVVTVSCNLFGGHCEYEDSFVDARVVIGAPEQGQSNCANDPVRVTVLWDDHSYDLTTSDERNPPLSYLGALGIVDGGLVRINP